MRTVKVIIPQTRSFNILSKLYELTKDGDTKVTKYFNRNFIPVSVNNANYKNNPLGA